MQYYRFEILSFFFLLKRYEEIYGICLSSFVVKILYCVKLNQAKTKLTKRISRETT